MGLVKQLTFKAISLLVVLLCVLLLTVVVIGATGISDSILNAILSDRIRLERTALSQAQVPPDEIEVIIEEVRQVITVSLGLDKPWYVRLPSMM